MGNILVSKGVTDGRGDPSMFLDTHFYALEIVYY